MESFGTLEVKLTFRMVPRALLTLWVIQISRLRLHSPAQCFQPIPAHTPVNVCICDVKYMLPVTCLIERAFLEGQCWLVHYWNILECFNAQIVQPGESRNNYNV